MAAIIIGISGVTCGGKTTLANELKNLFPDSIMITQDDYFLELKDPRHVWCKELNHINFDVITGLDMEKMLKDIQAVIGDRKLLTMELLKNRVGYNKHSVEFLKTSINEKLKEKKVLPVILDGFLLYAYKPLLPFIHLKYFFTLNYEQCLKRRNGRTYDPPDVPGYFESYVWPAYLKHYDELKREVSDIIYFDGAKESPIENVLTDIFNILH